MRDVSGGVCAPKGFVAGGIRCGIKKSSTKYDLALVYCEVPCQAAAVYTTNKVFGAPITVTRKNLEDGLAQAIVCNSGNANTCNADGVFVAEEMCRMTAEALHVKPTDVIIGSTGVIGQPLPLDRVAEGIKNLAPSLTRDGAHDAQIAIMTTDLVPKETAVALEIGGKTVTIGAMAKGSGMIRPNMATMLVFLTTDCAITTPMLQKALRGDVQNTFNMISIDGDTSTNDMAVLLANGMAGNKIIDAEGEDFSAFMKALNTVTVCLCKKIAADGEGVSRLLECSVTGAKDADAAKKAAKAVICSSLVKTAMFGADANWGRVLCAVGYSGADVDVGRVNIRFRSPKGNILLCENGMGVPFSEEKAKEILLEKEIEILLEFGDGEASATAWGCDLTYEYVKINGDYRT